MNTLPDTPGALLRDAVVALEECEDDPRYAIDMEAIHHYKTIWDLCLVCLAGAVMAKRLGCDRLDSLTWFRHDENGWPAFQLLALEEFRNGSVASGLLHLGVEDSTIPSHFPVTKYAAGAEQCKRDLRELADHLDEVVRHDEVLP